MVVAGLIVVSGLMAAAALIVAAGLIVPDELQRNALTSLECGQGILLLRILLRSLLLLKAWLG